VPLPSYSGGSVNANVYTRRTPRVKTTAACVAGAIFVSLTGQPNHVLFPIDLPYRIRCGTTDTVYMCEGIRKLTEGTPVWPAAAAAAPAEHAAVG
jgi:hypothetical protein